MSAGQICRRCAHWQHDEQVRALYARCDLLTGYYVSRRAIGCVTVVSAWPIAPMVMTAGHDTCSEFTIAEHDETGARVKRE